MKTRIIRENVEDAARILRAGGLVAVPSETVYGLAGNGLDERAVAAIYEVKGRPAVKPLSLMVPDSGALDRCCLDVPAQARALARRFWPGPLTLVLRARAEIPAIVLAGGKTVGLRCPDHPLTLALLRELGFPLAAPSANPSGKPSPKTAEQVLACFDGLIEGVIDGGPCGLGRESTLIDMSAAPYRILREGALPGETVAQALADELKIVGITGGTGCGKTTALQELRALGALVIDCDELYHELLRSDAELLAALEAAFPGTVRRGVLDRGALAAIAFGDPAKLELLNVTTHRFVTRAVDARLRDWAMAGGRIAAIDAVELISAGLSSRCVATVGILAGREQRICRVMARDGLGREAAERRVQAQRPDSYYRDNCTHILWNNTDRERFAAQSRQLFKEILKEWTT